MARKPVKDEDLRVEASSGNVFADLGFPDPDEELARAHLASCIRRLIAQRRLTQKAAASLMGIDQPKVSALVNGDVVRFSSERLMRLLRGLGQDVDIVVRDTRRSRTRGRIRIVEEKLDGPRRTVRRAATRG